MVDDWNHNILTDCALHLPPLYYPGCVLPGYWPKKLRTPNQTQHAAVHKNTHEHALEYMGVEKQIAEKVRCCHLKILD